MSKAAILPRGKRNPIKLLVKSAYRRQHCKGDESLITNLILILRLVLAFLKLI